MTLAMDRVDGHGLSNEAIVTYCQIRLRYNAVAFGRSLISKRSQTRRSTSVLKVGVP